MSAAASLTAEHFATPGRLHPRPESLLPHLLDTTDLARVMHSVRPLRRLASLFPEPSMLPTFPRLLKPGPKRRKPVDQLPFQSPRLAPGFLACARGFYENPSDVKMISLSGDHSFSPPRKHRCSLGRSSVLSGGEEASGRSYTERQQADERGRDPTLLFELQLGLRPKGLLSRSR